MGLYDTINVPCPKCGKIYQTQSKSGKCKLDVYNLNHVPLDVLLGVNRYAPFTCCSCGSQFKVDVDSIVYAKSVFVTDKENEAED